MIIRFKEQHVLYNYLTRAIAEAIRRTGGIYRDVEKLQKIQSAVENDEVHVLLEQEDYELIQEYLK